MVLLSAVILWGDDVDGDIDDAVGCGVGGGEDVDDDGDEGYADIDDYDDAQGDCLVGRPWLAAWCEKLR